MADSRQTPAPPERSDGMNKTEFYNYITENFNVDGAFGRMLNNVLDYAVEQGLTGRRLHAYLAAMLDGTIGLTDKEIKMAAF